MFTVKVGDQEEVCYQFCDMRVGDIFMANGNVYARCPQGVDDGDMVCNAVDLRLHNTEYFELDTLVEPIEMEWEEFDVEED